MLDQGKSLSKRSCPSIPLDEFFEVLAHNTHAEAAQLWGVTETYVRNLSCARVTDKAVQDGTTRAAIRNDLNCQRAANGVIPKSMIRTYASKGEHCAYGGVKGLSRRSKAGNRARASSAARSSIQRPARGRSAGSIDTATKPRSSAAAIRQQVTNPDVANYQGHGIYESDGDDSDYEEPPQGTDDFSDSASDVTELEERDDGGMIPETKALADILGDVPAWFKLSQLEQYAGPLSIFKWHEVMLFSDKKLAKYGVAAASARASFLAIFGKMKAALAEGRDLEKRDIVWA